MSRDSLQSMVFKGLGLVMAASLGLVLAPGESPDSAAARFRVFSGMDLDYWQEFYLLGEADALADRIRGKIEALGGVEHVILNPLDWDVRTLERIASDVLPRLRD